MKKKGMRALLAWALALIMMLSAGIPAWAEEGMEGDADKNEGQIVVSSGEQPQSNQDEPKQDEPKQDEPKQDEPKQDEPKQDEPKQDEPKQDEPKQDEPKQDEPKQDEPKQDEPKQDEPKQDEPKQDEPNQDEPKQDEPKQDETQSGEGDGKQGGQPATVPTTPLQPALQGGVTMVVKTGNAGKLHLREQPTTASASLGLFPNGTQVKVHGIQFGWALVTVYGMTGYMYTGYLAGVSQPQPQPQPVTPPSMDGAIQYVIRTGNTGKLHLRMYASTGAPSLGLFPNGTVLKGVDQHNGWVYVSLYGMNGYMMRRFLTTDAGQPQPQPQPVTPTLDGAVIKVVRTGNTGKLHLREFASTAARSLGLYPNGATLEAKDLGNGWSYVRINGVLGYMMTRFLADPSAAPITPVQPVTPTAGYAKTYQQRGSYINLRSSKASSNLSNVIAHIPCNTTVTVLEWGTTYTKVSYNGLVGYILNPYLRPIQ